MHCSGNFIDLHEWHWRVTLLVLFEPRTNTCWAIFSTRLHKLAQGVAFFEFKKKSFTVCMNSTYGYIVFSATLQKRGFCHIFWTKALRKVDFGVKDYVFKVKESDGDNILMYCMVKYAYLFRGLLPCAPPYPILVLFLLLFLVLWCAVDFTALEELEVRDLR